MAAVVPLLLVDLDDAFGADILTVPPKTNSTVHGVLQFNSDDSISGQIYYGGSSNRYTDKPNPNGDIYVETETHTLTRPLFEGVGTYGCYASLVAIKGLSTSDVPNFAIPDNIQPNKKNRLFGFGLDFQSPCSTPSPETPSNQTLITDKDMRVTLHGKADKKPYYFSPRDGILQAQPIPICTSTIIHTSNNTLQGNNTICYGKHGDDMVIITKRLTGFYGAANTVTPPTNPIDLNAAIDPVVPDPAAQSILTIPKPDNLEISTDYDLRTITTTNGDRQTTFMVRDEANNKYVFTPVAFENEPNGQVGDVYIPTPTRTESNPIFFNSVTNSYANTDCDVDVWSITELAKTDKVPSFTIPSNINPTNPNGIVGLALDFGPVAGSCKVDMDAKSPNPIFTEKEMRFTIYDTTNQPYYFSPRDDITTAVQIPACTTDMIHLNNQSLKGTTKMCYGKNGDDIVIITKRIAFYAVAGVPRDSGTILTIPPLTDEKDYAGLSVKSTTERDGVLFYDGDTVRMTDDGNKKRATADIYLEHDTSTLPRTLFAGTGEYECDMDFERVKNFDKNARPKFVVPDNITPTQKNELFAYGLGFDKKCKPNPGKVSNQTLITDTEMRYTIYNQTDKKPFYFSPRDSISAAQPIPACTTAILDTNNNKLKGHNTICYGKHGDDIVIITKRLVGFYGVANNITAPANPIDLNAAPPRTESASTYAMALTIPPLTDTKDDSAIGFDQDEFSDGKIYYGGNDRRFIDHLTKPTADIYLAQDTNIVHPLFKGIGVYRCNADLRHVATLNTDKVPKFAIPDNIVPKTPLRSVHAYGLDFASCTPADPEAVHSLPLITTKEIRYTIYGKAEKTPYYFSPRDRIPEAQPIPVCTTDILDTTTNTLKGNNTICYGIHGDDIVIITKRLTGFYGAADTVNPPKTPVDLNAPTVPRDTNILTLAPPSDFPDKPDPDGKSLSVTSDPTTAPGAYIPGSDRERYTGHVNTRIGDLHVQNDTKILPNEFPETSTCVAQFRTVNLLIADNNYGNLTLKVPTNLIADSGSFGPNFIKRAGCNIDLTKNSTKPLITDKEMRFTIYNKTDEHPYYFSPRENITKAQPIPACTDKIIDTTTNTLKDKNIMCYGKHGDDIVIITKRLTGFYGTAGTIIMPTHIINFNPGPPPPPSDSDDTYLTLAPTFGRSLYTGEQVVTCGYMMDDTCRDVTAYHVQYERNTIQTNTTHTFALKAYAPTLLRNVVLAFSVPNVGAPLSTAEAYISVNLGINYSEPSYHYITDVTIHDPNNIIDYDITGTIVSTASCSGGELQCTQVTIPDVLFREVMNHEPFAIQVTDTLSLNAINYMNEGVFVEGPSLNTPPTVQPGLTLSRDDGRPVNLILVRTDKVSDLWADAFGNTWSRNSFGHFVIVEYAPYAGTTPVCTDINDRICAPFKVKLDWHTQKMIELRDSLYDAYKTKAYAEIDNIFTYEFGDMDSRTRTLINLGWLTE